MDAFDPSDITLHLLPTTPERCCFLLKQKLANYVFNTPLQAGRMILSVAGNTLHLSMQRLMTRHTVFTAWVLRGIKQRNGFGQDVMRYTTRCTHVTFHNIITTVSYFYQHDSDHVPAATDDKHPTLSPEMLKNIIIRLHWVFVSFSPGIWNRPLQTLTSNRLKHTSPRHHNEQPWKH